MPKLVQVLLTFPEVEGHIIEKNAKNLGLSLNAYFKMMSKPCEICGNDKVILEKLKGHLNSIHQRKINRIHLFIFINSEINILTKKTDLLLSEKFIRSLDIPHTEPVYTTQKENSFFRSSHQTEAILAVYKNGLITSSHCCLIADNEITSL